MTFVRYKAKQFLFKFLKTQKKIIFVLVNHYIDMVSAEDINNITTLSSTIT